jgi:hypothetical protein
MSDAMTSDAAPRAGNAGTWAGFLAAAFLIVGLMGFFATYAAPLPYQRAMHREAVLDRLEITPPAQWGALRDDLGDSADAVLNGAGPIEPRIAAERVAMRARFEAEAAATASRLRLIIVVITLTGAAFGAVTLGLQGRR